MRLTGPQLATMIIDLLRDKDIEIEGREAVQCFAELTMGAIRAIGIQVGVRESKMSLVASAREVMIGVVSSLDIPLGHESDPPAIVLNDEATAQLLAERAMRKSAN